MLHLENLATYTVHCFEESKYKYKKKDRRLVFLINAIKDYYPVGWRLKTWKTGGKAIMSSPPPKKNIKIELCKVSSVIFKGFFGINMTPIYLSTYATFKW